MDDMIKRIEKQQVGVLLEGMKGSNWKEKGGWEVKDENDEKS